MTVAQISVFLVGLTLVVWTLLSAIRTVVLPRSAVSVVARVVFRSTGWLFRLLAGEGRTYEHRDRVMALYAPVGLLLLPVAWLSLVTVGGMCMFWALGDRTWSEAFLVSGSSLLTLGFAPVSGLGEQLVAFGEAALGLGLLALMISFLPSIYAAFSRRENEVALLEVRAGSPPSAVFMLTMYHRLGWLDDLPTLWGRWESWFADVEESHTSYSALTFFRSPQADRSWVTAAGTILDAASMAQSVLDRPADPRASLCIRAGYLALRQIGSFFGIVFDPDPRPDDPISLTRAEFDDACRRLAEAGVPLRPDRDRAWADFAGWRVNYDTVLLALAELTMAPYAPWTSDRSTTSHRRPRIRRWGARRERRQLSRQS